jgi:hypothetical protein
MNANAPGRFVRVLKEPPKAQRVSGKYLRRYRHESEHINPFYHEDEALA